MTHTGGHITKLGTRRAARFTAAIASFTGMVLAQLFVVVPQPAYAASIYTVAGNFVGDSAAEIFQYRPGTAPDYLLYQFDKDGGSATYTPYAFTVSGSTYDPLAADIDADGYDEIIWYAPGTDQDYIWNFTSPTTFTQTTATSNGTFTPVSGDFTGDGYEDIVWYAAGTAQDYIWDYDTTGFAAHPLTLNGVYRPVAGTFTGDGAEDVIFYAPGTGTDYLTDFDPGPVIYTSTALDPVNGTSYQPFSLDSRGDGYDDVFWYAPGGDVDPYWNYTPTGRENLAYEVDLTYTPAAGDLFADGHGDVFWFGTTSYVWDWHDSPTGLTRSVWDFGTGPDDDTQEDVVTGTLETTLPE